MAAEMRTKDNSASLQLFQATETRFSTQIRLIGFTQERMGVTMFLPVTSISHIPECMDQKISFVAIESFSGHVVISGNLMLGSGVVGGWWGCGPHE
jgi:hypothetical protein